MFYNWPTPVWMSDLAAKTFADRAAEAAAIAKAEGESGTEVAGISGVPSDLAAGALQWTNPSTAVQTVKSAASGNVTAQTIGVLIPPALILAAVFAGGSSSRRRR